MPTDSLAPSPVISDPQADRQFQEKVRQDYPQSYEFENRYVDHEMAHIGHVFATGLCPVAGKEVLEFGCNVGATSVVLAHYGANVTAVDISADSLDLARLNAQRYGVAGRIRFQLLKPGKPLPFTGSSFDVVTCNSVLEYVSPELLPSVQRELSRVLRPGGLLLVFGTSNRVSPVEAHSGRWFTNYTPGAVDRYLRRPLERGVSPWRLRRGFGRGYDDLLSGWSGARRYIELKRTMGLKGWRLTALRGLATAAALSPVSIGLLLPYATVLLRKTQTAMSASSRTDRFA
jgi:SAM-dependent methyltransferase